MMLESYGLQEATSNNHPICSRSGHHTWSKRQGQWDAFFTQYSRSGYAYKERTTRPECHCKHPTSPITRLLPIPIPIPRNTPMGKLHFIVLASYFLIISRTAANIIGKTGKTIWMTEEYDDFFEHRSLVAPLQLVEPQLKQTLSSTKMSLNNSLTFENCQTDQNCKGERFCAFLGGRPFVKHCNGTHPCICLPPKRLQLCFVNSDCPHGEICADTILSDASACVSKRAAKRNGNISKISPAKNPKGFTLDSCREQEDCFGDRNCKRFVEDTPLCSGTPPCACVNNNDPSCFTSSDCVTGEVCSRTPFSNVTVCTSKQAERAYGGFKKVPAPGICPVRINQDPPQKAPSSQFSLVRAAHDSSASTTMRIVGGGFASPNLLGYMAAVNGPGFRGFCSGTLISPNWIMTAAHCSSLFINNNGTVGLGTSQLGVDGIQFKTLRSFIHPKFISGEDWERFAYDIAVLEISGGPLPKSKFMKINDDPHSPSAGEFARAVGYGRTYFLNSRTKKFALRQVDVPVTSFQICNSAHKNRLAPILKRKQICAGYRSGDCSPWYVSCLSGVRN